MGYIFVFAWFLLLFVIMILFFGSGIKDCHHECDIHGVVTLSIILFIGGTLDVFAMIGCLKSYALPHHGLNATFCDVQEGEAHIDTIKTICGKDTTYRYEINWNDVK